MVPLGPLRRAFAKTVVTAAHEMIDANRAVPWHTPIPLHIAVETINFPFGAKIEIIGVAHPSSDEFNVLCVGVESQQETARRPFARAKPIAIFGSRQYLIVGIIAVRRGRREIARQIHEIAIDIIDHLVRSEHQRVRPVLAAFTGQEEIKVVILVVVIGVAQSVQANTVRTAAADVEAIECIEHAHG